MPDPPPSSVETEDLRAILDTELANLPDRFRSVVVLCLVEGRTNAEAATILGIPVGTVDSRLNTARKRLQAVLTRRGVACGVAISLEQLLGESVSAAGVRFQELISHTVRVVLAEAAGPGAEAVSPAVADLARGVTMTTTKLRLLAAIGVTLGLLGGAGAGVYFATAADDPASVKASSTSATDTPDRQPATDPSRPAKTNAPIASNDDPSQPAKKDKPIPPEAGTVKALEIPFGRPMPPEGVRIRELLDFVEETTYLVVRVDVAAFRRIGAFHPDEGGGLGGEGEDANTFLERIYKSEAVLPRKVEKLPIRDVLADALAQVRINHPCTYQVRGNQLVIVPAYIPPNRPGLDPLNPDPTGIEDLPVVETRLLHEQIYGGVVRVAAERMPLAEILADLRKQTGANIVLDPRCQEKAETALTVNLSDARLYDALRVIADMAELQMVYAGNIYYVTTPENAKVFQPAPKPAPPANPFGGGGIGGPLGPGMGGM